jgi:L-fucose isomerase-like protein
MYQTQVNEYSWKRTFGIDFPQYDTAQVFKEMEKVDDGEARKVEKDFLSKVDKVHWEADNGDRMEKDAIFTQAKMFLAFQRMKKLYDIDVFANKCMPEMSAIPYGYGYAGCLATCMLNEAGTMIACEADVPAALSMYILHLLSDGQKVFSRTSPG